MSAVVVFIRCLQLLEAAISALMRKFDLHYNVIFVKTYILKDFKGKLLIV